MAHAVYKLVASRPGVTRDADWYESLEKQWHDDMTFTPRELRFVYECICDPDNFKGPFQTTIAPKLLDAATEAVRYFTNTALEVLGTDHLTRRVMIRSKGQS